MPMTKQKQLLGIEKMYRLERGIAGPIDPKNVAQDATRPSLPNLQSCYSFSI